MRRPRLLDLFCGAGGASMGYHRAGFDVAGVDLNPQPHYPFAFHQGDALEMLRPHGPGFWDDFDAIHASPPCQDHSSLRALYVERHGTGWMLAATVELVARTGLPWVVENVVGAPLPHQPSLDGRYGLTLCGTMFGLGTGKYDLRRHRLFESSLPIEQPQCCHRRPTIGVYGHGETSRARSRRGAKADQSEAREAMGIDWMNREELSQAIPPAYAEFIGTQLLAHLKVTT